jgi:Conjugal transfer protein TrbL
VTTRWFARLLGVGVAMVVSALAVQPLYAQGMPQPPAPGGGLGDLLSDPGKWMTTMFNAALVGLGSRTTDDVVGFMSWLMGSSNLISQTPPGLSYGSEVVGRLWGTVRTIADAGLGVVTVWSGVNLMIHPHIRAPYHGALELVPRVMLSGVLVNSSLYWGQFVIDLNNALCQAFGSASLPAWQSALQPADAPALLKLIAMAIYLVMGLLLFGQMLMRLALLDALLVIGPLALLCWVLPQTYSWARLWFNTFFATVFVQSIQVLVLQLGSELVQHLPTLLSSPGSAPADSWRSWLVTLLLGVAVLQLARKIPRLMPGYPGGGSAVGTASSLGTLRMITSFLRLSNARGSK